MAEASNLSGVTLCKVLRSRNPDTNPDCHAAADELDQLRSVALAAQALVQSANNRLAADEVSVDEPALTALESALEAAGYGMSEEEAVDGAMGA